MADALDSKSSESNLMRVQVPPPVLVASVADAPNLQMNREFFKARLYLSMAEFFESLNMPDAAKWMEAQAEERTGHAIRLYSIFAIAELASRVGPLSDRRRTIRPTG